jgi:tellurite resistance protein TehA-like permease
MGNGIVSMALKLVGAQVAAEVLLVVAVALWLVLGALWLPRVIAVADVRRRSAREPETLCFVAACCVLATRVELDGQERFASAFLLVGALVWLPLTAAVLRHWRRPARGGHFVLVVAAQGVAVAGATLADAMDVDWLALFAFVPFVFGIVMYVFVLGSFDLRELSTGLGDQWVAGGALAISALAGAKLAGAGVAVAATRSLSVALWVLAMLWLPALVLAELRHPRMRFHARRWSTVFPVGMYAAMSFAVATSAQAAWIGEFARTWTVAAAAIWAVVAAGSLWSFRD